MSDINLFLLFLALIYPFLIHSFEPCMILILQKLPKRMVPTDLELTGAISVRFPPRVCVTGSYEVLPEDDGRVKMTCWKDFINAVGWKVKTKIVMMFCRCDDHTCLFVSPLDALLLHK